MRIPRQITHDETSAYAGLRWKTVDVEVCHADANQRVCLTDIEVPASWSHQAAQTFVRYYVRRAGVPTNLLPVPEEGVPSFLWRSVPDTAALAALKPEQRYGHETSAKQVFHRMAGMWTYWGFKGGYFDTEADAKAYYDEMCALLARQVVAPNSPQWFNAGLHWAYGLQGPAQGHFFGDMETGRLKRSANAYEHPQLHACFLHSVKDDLVNEGGIMHLFEREARVFKYGSGAGANMSAIRGAGEPLSSGSAALGLMRFLSVGDKAAGAIHAGGLPRRAGKMVVIDIDHPDVMGFIRWKGEEQYKAAALITGARVMRKHLTAVMSATASMEGPQRFAVASNPALATAVTRARRAMIPERAIDRVIAYARQGFNDMHIPLYSAADGSDLFFTIAAHQTRQAVRLSDRFMEAVEDGEQFSLRNRTNGDVAAREPARVIMEDLAHAVWATGEPTIQFADRIAALNPCPATGPVRASTPASEYLFLDDTACPLAAINLLACADAKGQIDIALFSHVVRLSTLMLDISVGVAQYPSREMARLTLGTRPIGLGLANVAGLLMRLGLAYDSDEGRATVAHVFALLTGEAANSSADLARELGAFSECTANRDTMLKLIRQRREQLATHVPPQRDLAEMTARLWEMALIKSEAYGMRNAQLSCVPPTSTIARVMDCDTLGLAPVASLVRHVTGEKGTPRKTLSANATYALQGMGLNAAQIEDLQRHICGHASLASAPAINHTTLKRHGFTDVQLRAVDEALEGAVDIHAAFDPWVLGERFCREQLNMSQSEMYDASFSILAHLGFSAEQVAAANAHACGQGDMQGVAHLTAPQVRAFSVPTAEAQLRMLAAVQPFITGGIAHTVQLAASTTVEACEALIWQAWRAGLTAVSFQREGCAVYQDVEGIADMEADAPEPLVFREAVASLSGGISEVASTLAQRFLSSKRELPLRRHGFTQKTEIAGQTVYLRTGEYTEGALGEVMLDLPQEGKLTRALAQHFARAMSLALQHGVPLSAFVEAFANPGTARDAMAAELAEETHAVIDYLFAELAQVYLAEDEPATRAVQQPSKAAS
ncbi:MAG: vitamin B12-dependent ribonucleotide reductase [Azospirillum brasilense]|nr:MAG: vitamin B12-dependent ribonucleotide reductase [Azospirillum brasilense]